MSEFDKLLSLGLFPLFQNATPNEIAMLSANTKIRAFQAGEYLLQEGKPVEFIHLITHGKVQLFLDQKETMLLEGVSTIGVFAGLSESPKGQGALAIEETRSIELPMRVFLTILEENFSQLRMILSAMFTMISVARKKVGRNAGFPTTLTDQPEFIPAKLGAVDRLIALNSMALFADTGIDAVAQMSNELVEVRKPAGHVLWEEGDKSDFMLCIIGGVVKCTSDEQSYQLGPQDFVGSLDAWAKSRRSFKVEVLVDLVALRLPIETMLDTFEDHFNLAENLMKNLANSILEFQRQAVSMDQSDAN